MVVVAVVCASCSARLVDFTVISSKNVQLTYDRASGRQVVGKSNKFLGIGASIKGAMDNALKEAGPEYDILVDGVVYFNDYVFVTGYKVTGTALSSKTMRAELGDEGFEEWYRTHNVFVPEEAEKDLANRD